MSDAYDTLNLNDTFEGDAFSPTRETIKEFCDASLDHNPLHLDDRYVHDNFASSSEFDGIVMHGMSQFSMYSRMLTEWGYARGGLQRRLETRWLKPVKPGDTVRPSAVVAAKQATKNSRFVVVAVKMTNQRGETVSMGEATLEFPPGARPLP